MSGSRAFYGPRVGDTAGTVAAGDHHHAGADVDSGTVAYARLPVGAAASTVAAGDDSRFAGVGQIPADRGLIAWNMPIYAATTTAAMSPAGQINFSRLRRVPAGTITNLALLCTVVGNTLTSGQCFGALFSAAGTLIGQTVDQAAAWASTGLKLMALATPYVAAAGDYYVGFWYNGTTGPSFARFTQSPGGSVITNAGLSAPNFEAGICNTGLTTTAPGSMGAQTGIAPNWWVAVS